MSGAIRSTILFREFCVSRSEPSFDFCRRDDSVLSIVQVRCSSTHPSALIPFADMTNFTLFETTSILDIMLMVI